jgi:integrase
VASIRTKTLNDGSRAYLVRYRAPNGRERSHQFRRKRDATVFAAATEAQIATGDFVDPNGGKLTYTQWWEQWWPTEAVSLRASTRARDEGTYKNHLKPRFGSVPLNRIEHLDIREWVGELIATGLAPASVQKCHQVMGKSLRAAVAARRLRFNAAESVPLPRIEREEMRFLSPKEIDKLAAKIDPRYRHVIYLLAYGGLRIGEAAGLQWRNVQLIPGHLDVVQTVVEVSGRVIINPPKTNAGRRRVPFPDVVAKALAASTAPNPDPDGFVVPAPTGGPLRVPAWRQRVWVPAIAAAGMGGLRIHDLRHTAVSLWISAGASPLEVAKRAGHTSVSVALDRYGHLLESDRDAVTKGLDRIAAAATDASASAVARAHRRG